MATDIKLELPGGQPPKKKTGKKEKTMMLTWPKSKSDRHQGGLLTPSQPGIAHCHSHCQSSWPIAAALCMLIN